MSTGITAVGSRAFSAALTGPATPRPLATQH